MNGHGVRREFGVLRRLTDFFIWGRRMLYRKEELRPGCASRGETGCWGGNRFEGKGIVDHRGACSAPLPGPLSSCSIGRSGQTAVRGVAAAHRAACAVLRFCGVLGGSLYVLVRGHTAESAGLCHAEYCN